MELLKFSRKGCIPCMILGLYLEDKGISYTEMDVDNEEDALKLAELGIEVDSVPILVMKKDDTLIDFVVGFNPSNPSEINNLISNLK